LKKGYVGILDEIVQPYEKINLTNINTRLNKLQNDIKKIPIVLADLNTQSQTMNTNPNAVCGV
jgi:hypothetical protein